MESPQFCIYCNANNFRRDTEDVFTCLDCKSMYLMNGDGSFRSVDGNITLPRGKTCRLKILEILTFEWKTYAEIQSELEMGRGTIAEALSLLVAEERTEIKRVQTKTKGRPKSYFRRKKND